MPRIPAAARRLLRGPITAAALAVVVAGCRTEAPTRAALARAVEKRSPPALLLARVEPDALARGEHATIEAIAELEGREVARFPLADSYFLTIFTVLDELRRCGLHAEAAPALWGRRLEALREAVSTLSDAEVLVHLSRSAQPGDVLAMQRLDGPALRAQLASRRVLLAARTGLPPAERTPPPTARRIRERWFTREDAPQRPWELRVAVDELELRLQGLAPGGTQRAVAALRFTLTAPTARYTLRCRERVVREGSGLTLQRETGRYVVSFTGEHALSEAIRRCTRRLLSEAIERAAPAPPPRVSSR